MIYSFRSDAHWSVWRAANEHDVPLKKLEKLGLMSIEEAIEEINRRSIKLSALISSQNSDVPLDPGPGYTVTYTAAASTHSTQPPVAGPWVKSIDLSPELLGSSITASAATNMGDHYIPLLPSTAAHVECWKTDPRVDNASTVTNSTIKMMIEGMGWDADNVLLKLLQRFQSFMIDIRGAKEDSATDYCSKMRRLISTYIKQSGSTLVDVFTEKGLLSIVEFSNSTYNSGKTTKTGQTYLSAFKCFTNFLSREKIIPLDAYTSVIAEVSQGISSKAK